MVLIQELKNLKMIQKDNLINNLIIVPENKEYSNDAINALVEFQELLDKFIKKEVIQMDMYQKRKIRAEQKNERFTSLVSFVN